MTELQRQEIAKADWNIKDAHEAMECAIGMRDWEGVQKYAKQLREWDSKRYSIVSQLSPINIIHARGY
jgi:hypothetical protein